MIIGIEKKNSVFLRVAVLDRFYCKSIDGPAKEILVLIASASIEGSDEPARTRSLF